jgi:hypothetical protein
MADHHLPQGHNLSGTDQVLVGNNVRDRFLTAFILRQGGFIEIVQPHRPQGMRPLPSGEDAFFLDLEEDLADQDREAAEREGEPLSLSLVEVWFPDDDV